MPIQVILKRIQAGWCVEDSFTIPYPCEKVVCVEGRRYTEEALKEKFGLTYEQYRRSLMFDGKE